MEKQEGQPIGWWMKGIKRNRKRKVEIPRMAQVLNLNYISVCEEKKKKLGCTAHLFKPRLINSEESSNQS
jgi:hypothetical protein